MTSDRCHNVTNAVTRCVQSQSQSQSQSPFLCLKAAFWPKSVATEVQTARATTESATRDELNDTPQRPSEAAAPTSAYLDARKEARNG